MRAAIDAGVVHMVFGDLFLADVRAYREQQLAGTGLSPVFPLWQRPTDVLARMMLSAGIRAIVTCVDPAQAPPGLAGRWFDANFLDQLLRGSTRAGRTASFTRSSWTDPGSVTLWMLWWGRSWNGTGSCSQTSSRRKLTGR